MINKFFVRFGVIVTAAFLLLSCTSREITAQDENVVLKNVFKDKFLIGAALNENLCSGKDERGAEIVKEQFNTISPENTLKWEKVHPELNKYNFEDADKFVDFGLKNNMFIVGHTLIWHNQTPRWVFEDSSGNPVDRETLLKRMKDHISTVVGHYKGKVKGWDVVNEALAEDGSFLQTKWLKIIGEDFISKAFEYAHEADPDAELYYNDFSLENAPKRNGAIEIVKKLKANGIRIDGVGLQGHYKMYWPSFGQIDSTVKQISALGVNLMITELDLDILPDASSNYGADINLNVEMNAKLNPYSKELPDSVDKAQQKRYSDIFSAFVKNADKITRVTFWGVTDSDSWLNNWPVRGRTSYPLLFDRSGKPNHSFDAVVKTVTIN